MLGWGTVFKIVLDSIVGWTDQRTLPLWDPDDPRQLTTRITTRPQQDTAFANQVTGLWRAWPFCLMINFFTPYVAAILATVVIS
jgi:hypothetical protein